MFELNSKSKDCNSSSKFFFLSFEVFSFFSAIFKEKTKKKNRLNTKKINNFQVFLLFLYVFVSFALNIH